MSSSSSLPPTLPFVQGALCRAPSDSEAVTATKQAVKRKRYNSPLRGIVASTVPVGGTGKYVASVEMAFDLRKRLQRRSTSAIAQSERATHNLTISHKEVL